MKKALKYTILGFSLIISIITILFILRFKTIQIQPNLQYQEEIKI